MNASITLRRLASFLGFSSVVASTISWRISSRSFGRSIADSSSRIASAPMPAVKLSGPNSSIAALYWSSESSCFSLNVVTPGSITT